jgi:hypothetical protein
VTAAWVAGSVRATALARRRLGRDGAVVVAGCAGLPAALEALAHGPYGDHVRPGQSLADAQRGLATAVLWHLRVLAGWLPAPGVEMLRVLAGWFELANVGERLRAFAGRPAEPPFQPGALATAWPRLAAAADPEQLRAVLAGSAWGDPGGTDPDTVALGLRLSWAERVTARVPAARPWAAGAVALLVAGRLFGGEGPLPAEARRRAQRVLGPDWTTAATMPQFTAALGHDARWAVSGAGPASRWRAQAAWWARLRGDGTALLSRAGFGVHRPLGAAALLAADAWQVRAALETAARGGPGGPAREVFDDLA